MSDRAILLAAVAIQRWMSEADNEPTLEDMGEIRDDLVLRSGYDHAEMLVSLDSGEDLEVADV